MAERVGDWMETFSGKKFWPLDPRAEEVRIEDIAHALSMICRFGGHCSEFYSVAEHSVLVEGMTTLNDRNQSLRALMHDAAEAYVGDVIRPIKSGHGKSTGILAVEAAVQEEIHKKFNISPHDPALPDWVKWADNAMLANEHKQLFEDANWWDCDRLSVPWVKLRLWSPTRAEREFLSRFRSLIDPPSGI